MDNSSTKYLNKVRYVPLMNFQGLNKIETVDFYSSLAMRRAQQAADEAKESTLYQDQNRFEKSKTVELAKIRAVHDTLSKQVRSIVESFPSLDRLPPFYLALVKLTLDYGAIKHSLGGLDWACKRIDAVSSEYEQRLKRTQDMTALNGYRRSFLGRTFSILKQVKKEFQILEAARRAMREFPTIKTSGLTVALAGYPNVGKSSLLKVLTSASPEIKAYAFTTKSLNLGYFTHRHEKIQVIDTPGTFNRPFEQMNSVEQISHLALIHLASVVIFVIDPTEQCGYSVKDQCALFKKLKLKYKLQYIIALNKADQKQDWVEVPKLASPTFEISASKKQGIDEITASLIKFHEKNKERMDRERRQDYDREE